MFEKKHKKTREIDMAPLVDMVFLLLIFFMITASFMKPVFRLDLPQASGGQKPEKKPDVVVSAASDEDIRINDSQVNRESLKESLETVMKETENFDVVFRGDKGIPYSTFVYVMESAKKAGAVSINIEHEGNMN